MESENDPAVLLTLSFLIKKEKRIMLFWEICKYCKVKVSQVTQLFTRFP